ncbi:MAG: bifunctional hydroxymethylpyrimidine kinase/phosphomethylpyrimidine kinase [Phycisphaeraceae bacterium]|nr:bifunctional hydroxymethylpyrimidine kinase/phosphomethylpyrimidine kinase [Phycisphaeraceae bacterium]
MAERTTPGIRAALTIAGSDSSGGAGIQADLKVFSIMDVYGATAITAITAQNTTAVRKSLVLDPSLVEEQIDAVGGDLKIDATKVGMLGNAAVAETVAKAVNRLNLFPLVVDPVMIAKSGSKLIDDAAIAVITKKLLPLAAVTTPNRHEAARLLGSSDSISDVYGATTAAKEICRRFGARACIVKGIRKPDDQEGQAVDVFVFRDAQGQERVKEVSSPWRITDNTHGSGCTFSAAITAALALGQPLEEAVQTGKSVISEALRQNTGVGLGNGPVNHLAWAKVKK